MIVLLYLPTPNQYEMVRLSEDEKNARQISYLIIHILQQVAGLQNGHPAPPVLEHPPLPLDLILDADVILIVHHLPLSALPHAVVRLHLHVQLGIAVHHAALLNQTLEWTDFHSQSEGFVGQAGEAVTSDLCLGGEDLFFSFFGFELFGVDDEGEGVQRFFGGNVYRIDVFAIFFLGDRRGRGDPHFLLAALLHFDLALDEMENLRLAPQEKGVTKDVFTGVLPRLMEAVHVELPDEAVDVSVAEEFGEDVVLKLINFLDGELAPVGHPVDN